MKSKFYQNNGLTLYAFACGYMQVVTNQIDNESAHKSIRLSKDGGYHLHTSAVKKRSACGYVGISLDYALGAWDCYDNLTEARKGFNKQVKQTFSEELKAYKAQSRLTVTLECIGESTPKHTLRNNGDFIKGYDTKQAAEVLAGALATLDLVDRHTAIEYLRNKINN